MRLQEREQSESGPTKGPDRISVSDESDRDTDLDNFEKMTYVEGRSPSGTWSLVTLLDPPPGPEPRESS